MDIIFQLYKPLFVIILGAAILCVIGCIVVIALLVFGDSDFNLCDCRDDVFSQIPVYPDASLVENSENSTTTTGSFVKTYETTDAFDDVAGFFEKQGCTKSLFSMTDGFECTNDGEHFWYMIEIDHEAENTSYTITFTWNCGCLD